MDIATQSKKQQKFSISQSNVMNMEIFVKDFSGTAFPRILKFGKTSDMTSCTVYKNSATYCLSVPLFVHFSCFPIKVVWPVMACHFVGTTFGCIRLLVDVTFRRVRHSVEKNSQVRHSVEMVNSIIL